MFDQLPSFFQPIFTPMLPFTRLKVKTDYSCHSTLISMKFTSVVMHVTIPRDWLDTADFCFMFFIFYVRVTVSVFETLTVKLKQFDELLAGTSQVVLDSTICQNTPRAGKMFARTCHERARWFQWIIDKCLGARFFLIFFWVLEARF